jgi:hypothetical protein
VIFLREVPHLTLRSFEHSTTLCHARHRIDAPLFCIFAPSSSFPTNKTLHSQVVRLQVCFFCVDCCVASLANVPTFSLFFDGACVGAPNKGTSHGAVTPNGACLVWNHWDPRRHELGAPHRDWGQQCLQQWGGWCTPCRLKGSHARCGGWLRATFFSGASFIWEGCTFAEKDSKKVSTYACWYSYQRDCLSLYSQEIIHTYVSRGNCGAGWYISLLHTQEYQGSPLLE